MAKAKATKKPAKPKQPAVDLALLEESAGMKIFEWGCSAPSKIAALGEIQGVPSDWLDKMRYGLPLPGKWPKAARFDMRPDKPRDTKLADMHSNRSSLVVIGPRILPLVRDLPTIELLPVAIHDHKGKVASADYHVVHTTHMLDCIDVEASGAERHISPSKYDPDELMRWNHLTLTAGDHAIPKVFRFKHVPGRIFVREDLAMAIEALELTKPYFTELPDV